MTKWNTRSIYRLSLFGPILFGVACTAPYQISDQPTFGVVDRFENTYPTEKKINLVFSPETKALRIKTGPSDILGAATIYDFNIGEAFSGRLKDLSAAVFRENTQRPVSV
ncbi:MAG: hypothetical protein O7F12_01720, partial [Nitrospirae bacterium]|nr:hypothetical protein [Nitrospirota bacterium]